MKLYIETTVPNFLFADDAPEKRNATQAFFDWLDVSSDSLYTSDLVFTELQRTTDVVLREKLLTTLANLDCAVLPISREANGLAERLIAEGAIPERYRDDAIHAALSILHDMDILVTWNMKHLVNARKIEAINQVALRAGLRSIRIHTPEEVMSI